MRSLKGDQVNQLFQGENNKRESHRALKGDGITFQIHILDLKGEDETYLGVPVLATFIPEEIGKDLIRLV
jgi:hypothetical protein